METKKWWVAFQAKHIIGISHFEIGLANFAATIHCNDSLHGKWTVVTLTLAYFITRDELIQKSIYDTDDNIYIYSGCNYSSCNPWWRHQMETLSALLALAWGIHRSPVNSPHKGQWRGPLKFPLTYAWVNDWVNNRQAGDLRCHRAHHDVTVMLKSHLANRKLGHGRVNITNINNKCSRFPVPWPEAIYK